MKEPESVWHYIWANQLFYQTDLKTVEGKPVKILSPGTPNSAEGPDFRGAHIVIDGIEWLGDVEIDMFSSDWFRHHHEGNPRFQNVILHVVVALQARLAPIPTLEIGSRVSASLCQRLTAWQKDKLPFPCAQIARQVPPPTWHAVYEQMACRRIEKRFETYRAQDFFQAFWEAIAYSYGLPYQGESFRMLAQRLPLRILERERNTPGAVASLLLGMVGAWETDPPPTWRPVYETWLYLHNKYELTPIKVSPGRRPTHHPHRRAAQLAALLERYTDLTLLLRQPPGQLPSLSGYWHEHYAIGKPWPTHPVQHEPLLYKNFLINALLPFQLYYFQQLGDTRRFERALQAFQNLPAEQHAIARAFAEHAYPARHAWDSQGQLYLFRYFCQEYRCGSCPLLPSLLLS
ncbi:MAG: DUF2851 family protein [Bacteroidia bacterium]